VRPAPGSSPARAATNPVSRVASTARATRAASPPPARSTSAIASASASGSTPPPESDRSSVHAPTARPPPLLASVSARSASSASGPGDATVGPPRATPIEMEVGAAPVPMPAGSRAAARSFSHTQSAAAASGMSTASAATRPPCHRTTSSLARRAARSRATSASTRASPAAPPRVTIRASRSSAWTTTSAGVVPRRASSRRSDASRSDAASPPGTACGCSPGIGAPTSAARSSRAAMSSAVQPPDARPSTAMRPTTAPSRPWIGTPTARRRLRPMASRPDSPLATRPVGSVRTTRPVGAPAPRAAVRASRSRSMGGGARGGGVEWATGRPCLMTSSTRGPPGVSRGAPRPRSGPRRYVGASASVSVGTRRASPSAAATSITFAATAGATRRLNTLGMM